MGFLDGLLGGNMGFGSGLAGTAYGGMPYYYSQQQELLRHPFSSMMLQQMIAEQQFPRQLGAFPEIRRKTKRVESRDVTPRERARKQINGAVQAVKEAQLKAKI